MELIFPLFLCLFSVITVPLSFFFFFFVFNTHQELFLLFWPFSFYELLSSFSFFFSSSVYDNYFLSSWFGGHTDLVYQIDIEALWLLTSSKRKGFGDVMKVCEISQSLELINFLFPFSSFPFYHSPPSLSLSLLI